MKHLIHFLIIILPLSSLAQSSQNEIGLQLGLHQSFFKDLNFSPLNYRGAGFGGVLSYERRTPQNNRVFAQADAQFGAIATAYSPYFNSARYLAHIEAAYLKNIRLSSKKIQLHTGAGYHTYLDFVSYDGTESITFFSLHSLDAHAQIRYQLSDKHQLSAQLSMPLFGLLIRPPYTGWDKFIVDNEDSPIKVFFRGKWTSLNDYFGIHTRLGYRFQLNDLLNLQASYQIRYYQTEELVLYRSWVNQFMLGLGFQF